MSRSDDCCYSDNYYFLTRLGVCYPYPTSIQNAEPVWIEVTTTMCRYVTEPPWSSQHQVDIVCPLQDSSPISPVAPPSDTFKKIITSLLNILIVPYTREETEAGSDKEASAEETADKPTPSTPALSHNSLLEGLLATGRSSTSTMDTKALLSSKCCRFACYLYECSYL